MIREKSQLAETVANLLRLVRSTGTCSSNEEAEDNRCNGTRQSFSMMGSICSSLTHLPAQSTANISISLLGSYPSSYNSMHQL